MFGFLHFNLLVSAIDTVTHFFCDSSYTHAVGVLSWWIFGWSAVWWRGFFTTKVDLPLLARSIVHSLYSVCKSLFEDRFWEFQRMPFGLNFAFFFSQKYPDVAKSSEI